MVIAMLPIVPKTGSICRSVVKYNTKLGNKTLSPMSNEHTTTPTTLAKEMNFTSNTKTKKEKTICFRKVTIDNIFTNLIFPEFEPGGALQRDGGPC